MFYDLTVLKLGVSDVSVFYFIKNKSFLFFLFFIVFIVFYFIKNNKNNKKKKEKKRSKNNVLLLVLGPTLKRLRRAQEERDLAWLLKERRWNKK